MQMLAEVVHGSGAGVPRGDGGAGQAEPRDEQEVRRTRLLGLSSRTHNLWFKGVVRVLRGKQKNDHVGKVGLEIWIVVVELGDLGLE